MRAEVGRIEMLSIVMIGVLMIFLLVLIYLASRRWNAHPAKPAGGES